jgi:hypothetical protein
MIPEDLKLKLIRYASKAPSGHNTQPWMFSMEENSIIIHPDFSRALSVVDSDNHALYISLGCALQNLIVAANQYGYEIEVKLKNENCSSIRVDFTKSSSVAHSDLFYCITKRQITRSPYSHVKLSDSEINELFSEKQKDGIHVKLFLEKNEIDGLMPFIIEASNLQFNNRLFVNELVEWIRFSKNEAMMKSDGIWSATMGLPNISHWMGDFIMKKLVSCKSEAKRWKNIVLHSAGLALFSVEKNDPEHWIRLGQAFQQFGLKATKMNIKHSHVNMPCEELAIRQKLIQHFHMDGLTPLLLIRFGFAEPMPYSLRRNLNELIIN